MPLIGCHISIAGGVENAPIHGGELGCDAIQIFTANQMQWRGSPISEESKSKYMEGLKNHRIKQVVTHDSYLINLGSPDPAKLAKSRKAFIEEMDRSEFLNIPYIIFHPGSHMGRGDDYALKTIAESLDYVIESRANYKSILLLENTAGQGTNVGYKFEQIRSIIDKCSYPDRLGVCFDTCHAFAAGYDIVSEEKYRETFKKFDKIIGLDRLRVFHINDSKRELGSRIDRHACLGEGLIGWEFFYELINDERFAELPMILETPGGNEIFAREIATLKSRVMKNHLH